MAVCTRIELVSLQWQCSVLTDELTNQMAVPEGIEPIFFHVNSVAHYLNATVQYIMELDHRIELCYSAYKTDASPFMLIQHILKIKLIKRRSSWVDGNLGSSRTSSQRFLCYLKNPLESTPLFRYQPIIAAEPRRRNIRVLNAIR